MKKPKKPTINTAKSIKITIITLAVIALLGYGSLYVIDGYNGYHRMSQQVSTEPIRSLILQHDPNTPAPVDFKTGDIYFPNAHVYLPNNGRTYGYQASQTDKPSEIAITSPATIERRVSRMIQAGSVEAVFSGVPDYQACLRGVTLMQTATAPSDIYMNPVLAKAIKLGNGKILYAYIEKSCPDNQSVAEQLSALKPY